MSLISKKTYCFDSKCDGNLIRQPFDKHNNLWLQDVCDTCSAKKYTLSTYGNVEYIYGDGRKMEVYC